MVGGGFDQCYNAQAVVVADSLLVVAIDVVQAVNDKQQLQPIWRFGTFTCRERNAEMLIKLAALPVSLGEATTLLADNGYFSAANVTACSATPIAPLIAMGRQPHYPPLAERLAGEPEPPKNPTPVEAMAHRLRTADGRKLYALRKQIPEPAAVLILAGRICPCCDDALFFYPDHGGSGGGRVKAKVPSRWSHDGNTR